MIDFSPLSWIPGLARNDRFVELGHGLAREGNLKAWHSSLRGILAYNRKPFPMVSNRLKI
jgi:hypothetical protein